MRSFSSAISDELVHGGPEMLRASIAHDLQSVTVHATHAYDYALIGEDRLMQMSIDRAVCCLRAAYETSKDLKGLGARRDSHDRSR